MAKKGNSNNNNNNNNSRGASASAVAAFVASNPNSRTAQAAAPQATAAPRAAAPVQTNAGPNPMGAPAAPARATQPVSVQQINNQNTLSQNLRAASGGNGVLSEKELLKISKTSGKDNEKVLEKAVGKGLMIGSKVVNQYQKGAYTDPKTAWYRAAAGGLGMSTGFDSPILNQLRSAGRQDKGSALFIGSKGSTATTLPRRSGFGMGAQPVPSTQSNTEQPVTTGEQAQDPIMPFVPEQLPEEKPEEQQDPGSGMLSGGGLGAAGANKLGRAKSRIRQLGIYGRGTGLLGRGLQYGNALNA